METYSRSDVQSSLATYKSPLNIMSCCVWCCRDMGNNERTRSSTRMLRWMCGVTRRDKILNEHIRGTTRVVLAYTNITETRLKWYGHVRRMKEGHIARRMLDVNIPGKRRRGRPNLRWKDACKRDMTKVGLKKDRATNRAEWMNKLISYTGDPMADDGTSQG